MAITRTGIELILFLGLKLFSYSNLSQQIQSFALNNEFDFNSTLTLFIKWYLLPIIYSYGPQNIACLIYFLLDSFNHLNM